MSLTRQDIWFDLPGELIAQHPPGKRRESRLLSVDRTGRTLTEHRFSAIPGILRAGDLLVLNDTRVTRARLRGTRSGTGGGAEILLLERQDSDLWKVLVKPSKRCREGVEIDFGHGLLGTVRECLSPGRAVMSFQAEGDLLEAMDEAGEVPLPPYIRRSVEPADEARYQTVYAGSDGAVAAPTAGLHFDEELLLELGRRGIETSKLTLHVGPGTFEPLRHDRLDMNRLEPERFVIGPECAMSVSRAVSERRRIIAVGTTSTRVLETAGPGIEPSEGYTSLFIRPPYDFKVVGGLVTNFHLPGSSLLCLVSAFMGLEFMREAYGRAMDDGFRFYSYGDAMLIL